MIIISRAAWGARHAAAYKNRDAPLPAARVWLHHSVTIAPDLVPPADDDDAAVRTLERIGQHRFGWGISYTFAVTPSGRVYEGHRIDGLGAHTAGQNSTSRAVCLVGDYDRRTPTGEQRRAVAELLAHGHRRGWWTQPRLAGGHRDAPGARTACPGRHGHAAIPEINQLAGRLAAGAQPEEDLMPSPEQLAEAVWGATTRNLNGDVVRADQILVATEARVADLQTRLAALEQRLAQTEARP